MRNILAIILLAAAAAPSIASANAGWGCVVVPGAGQICGETDDDKIPDEK